MNSSSINLWDFFPLTMCITLRERPERTADAKVAFRDAGFKKVLFYLTERQPDRDKAIMDSHLACMRYFLEQNVPHALIFEDDVDFNVDPAEHLPNVISFLQGCPHWGLFLLGGFIFRRGEQLTPHIHRGAALTNHAYIINRDFAQRYIQRATVVPPMSIDLLASIISGENTYVYTNPSFCLQRPSVSDGTWDKDNKSQEGWLSKVMVYTGFTTWGERWRYPDLPLLEKIKVHNGMTFFKFYRASLKKKLEKAEAAAAKLSVPPVRDPGPPGQFVLEEFV